MSAAVECGVACRVIQGVPADSTKVCAPSKGVVGEGSSMTHATRIGRLAGLAGGLGIGAALAATPGIASADDFQISFDGMDLLPAAGNTATATTTAGDWSLRSPSATAPTPPSATARMTPHSPMAPEPSPQSPTATSTRPPPTATAVSPAPATATSTPAWPTVPTAAPWPPAMTCSRSCRCSRCRETTVRASS